MYGNAWLELSSILMKPKIGNGLHSCRLSSRMHAQGPDKHVNERQTTGERRGDVSLRLSAKLS